MSAKVIHVLAMNLTPSFINRAEGNRAFIAAIKYFFRLRLMCPG